MEALLLEHPKIIDAAVIGVYSEGEATELPRLFPPRCAHTITPSKFPNSTVQGIRRPQDKTTTGGRIHSILQGDPRVGPKPRGETQVPQRRRRRHRPGPEERCRQDFKEAVARSGQGRTKP